MTKSAEQAAEEKINHWADKIDDNLHILIKACHRCRMML